MPAPTYATISGIAYKPAPNPTENIVAPDAWLWITPVSVTGTLLWDAGQKAPADANGLISFRAVYGSQINISGEVRGFERENHRDGVNYTVPSSPTVTLESVVSTTLVPTTGLTIQDETVPLPTLIGTMNFAGTGVVVTQSSAGVALVTISAGAGLVSSVFGRTGAVVAATNDYTFAQIDRTTSSLADITTRSASDLSTGTLPDARFPATLPVASGVNLTALNATNLASGTVPDARFPATLPAASGVNLTALNATNLASGTVPLGRLSGITDTEIAAGAAIAYSKLNLTGAILNADLAGSIADTNLLTIATAGKVSDSALSSNVALLNAANVFSALQTIDVGTTPLDGLLISIAQPGTISTRDSHGFVIRGSSRDGAGGHDVDWRQFVDVTNVAGTSTWTLQSRIDAASYVTKFSVSDTGNLDLAGSITSTGLNVNAGAGNIALDTTGRLTLGNVSASIIDINSAGLNQWHLHPNDLIIDTTGKVQIGDPGSPLGFGNATRLEVNDNGLYAKLGGQSAVITIGDVDLLTTSTVFETDVVNQTFSFRNGVLIAGTGPTTLTNAAGQLLAAAAATPTGSGNWVLADSPTLTTPALGTPSAGVLTSCTGLPPTTGIVGWPANASGVLTNNGSGTLTWAAGGGAGLGANTFTDLQTITQASANAGILASTGYSLTGSNATGMINLAGTWNTSGNPVAFQLAITNTASGATSKFVSLLAGAGGATEILSISKAGLVTSTKNADIGFAVTVSGQNPVGFGRNASIGGINLFGGETGTPSDTSATAHLSTNVLRLNSATVFGWALSNIGQNLDTAFSRNAAAIIEANNGTAGRFGGFKAGFYGAATAAIADGITIGTRSSGTPAAGLGAGLLYTVDSSTTANQSAARIAAVTTTATHASRAYDLVLSTYLIGTEVEVLRLKSSGRMMFGVPNSAVTDADLSNNQVSAYLDEAGALLKFRVRQSDGSYKTGQVAIA